MNLKMIENWYREYGPLVFRRCRQFLADENDVKDAVQEVFVLVLRNRERLKDEFPSSFLYRVATNVVLNMIRSRKRRKEVAGDEMLEIILNDDNLPEKVSIRNMLEKIFSGEPDSTKVMAVYHFVDGMTLDETAHEMRMSVSGVRKRLRLLKERLLTKGLLPELENSYVNEGER